MMQLKQDEIRDIAVMLCDYANIEGIGLEPHQVYLAIRFAVAANFPQDTIERLWRIHTIAEQDYLEA